MSRRLLLVEDDRALSIGLADAFGQEGFAVAVARDGDKGRDLLRAGGASMAAAPFDVVVLDLMLPGRSGLDLLRELRGAGSTVPVLLLTARGSEADKVLGLELGADDYVTKPFSLRELVARVRALVRREERREAGGANGSAIGRDGGAGGRDGGGGRGIARAPPPDRFRIGDAEVDLAAFELRRAGAVHPLSRKEAAMLALLFERRGTVVSRQHFLKLAWDGGEHVGTRTIDTHMLNLRQKLEPDPANPRWLLTVHGVGYRLAGE